MIISLPINNLSSPLFTIQMNRLYKCFDKFKIELNKLNDLPDSNRAELLTSLQNTLAEHARALALLQQKLDALVNADLPPANPDNIKSFDHQLEELIQVEKHLMTHIKRAQRSLDKFDRPLGIPAFYKTYRLF